MGVLVRRDVLESFLNDYLQPELFSNDVIVNGLQVEGNENVNHVVGAVSVTKELIEKAVEMEADAIITHHGLLLRGKTDLSGDLLKRK